MNMRSLVTQDDISLVPDSRWLDEMPGFKSFASQFLGLLVLICVVALVVAVVGWIVAKTVGSESTTQAEGKILATLLVAVCIGSMSGIVQWSMNEQIGFGSFTISGKKSNYDMDVCNLSGTDLAKDCD